MSPHTVVGGRSGMELRTEARRVGPSRAGFLGGRRLVVSLPTSKRKEVEPSCTRLKLASFDPVPRDADVNHLLFLALFPFPPDSSPEAVARPRLISGAVGGFGGV